MAYSKISPAAQKRKTPHPERILVRAGQGLGSIRLFQGITPDELAEIEKAARRQQYEGDSYLFFQGDPAEELHVVVSGRVKLTQLTPEGQQVILRYVGPGEAFGVIAVVGEMDYPVTAQAAEASQTVSWDQAAMRELMLRIPILAINALSILAGRTREFQDRLRELMTERVERRIARAVLRLTSQAGRKIEEGVLLDLPLTRQDLAEMTGTTLYTVSRTISQWEAQGLVKAGREQLIILRPHGLVVIAEDLPS